MPFQPDRWHHGNITEEMFIDHLQGCSCPPRTFLQHCYNIHLVNVKFQQLRVIKPDVLCGLSKNIVLSGAYDTAYCFTCLRKGTNNLVCRDQSSNIMSVHVFSIMEMLVIKGPVTVSQQYLEKVLPQFSA